MSGDAGGLIFGLLFAPVAIAAAGAVAVAYGVFKIGSALVGAAYNYAKQKHQEKQLTVNNCSAQLQSMYQDMQLSVENHAETFAKIAKETQSQLNAAAAAMQHQAETSAIADMAALDTEVQKTQQAVQKAMANHRKEVQDKILTPGRQQLAAAAKALDNAEKVKAQLVNWKSKTAADRAMQQAMANDSLRDALASLNMMKNIADGSFSTGFKTDYATLKASYDQAKAHYDNGMYESAYSQGRMVIREVAAKTAAQQMDQMELDFAAMELQARMEGLIDEMARRRFITIPTDHAGKESYTEDLDEFSQGKYAQMQLLLKEKLAEISNPANHYQIQKMAQEFDAVLEPQSHKIMQVSQYVLAGYKERMKVLEVVKEFMESQNYSMNWAVSPNDDPSQKLVVNFTNAISNSSISITLDNRAETGDIANMTLEVLTYYDNGRPVTEEDKRKLRDRLNNALREAGVMGGATCQGQINLPSSQPQLSTEEGVLDQPVRQIL